MCTQEDKELMTLLKKQKKAAAKKLQLEFFL
jgi:hypothetical protein